MLCYLACANRKWLLARPHTISNEISRGKFKNTHGDCLCCVFVGYVFALWDRRQFKTAWHEKREATDRRLQVDFREAEVSTAPLSKGEVSNGPLLTSNVLTACTQQPQWKLTV